jgi:glutamate-5-semialdehyde dehydrogenase
MKELNAVKLASGLLLNLKEIDRQNILNNLAKNLDIRRSEIIEKNLIDLKQAQELVSQKIISKAMLDRLKLSDSRIDQMIEGVKQIASSEPVLGVIGNEFINSQGVKIKKRRVPIGVLLMIFESRPNVVIDAASLAIKSGNALLLKGGKEAFESNKVLGEIIEESFTEKSISQSIKVIDSNDRETVQFLLKQKESIDLVVPRGGTGLVEMVKKVSEIPVISHYQGICHIFIDHSCTLDKAISIVKNAKIQRPGVCNAVETLLIHKDFSGKKDLLVSLAADDIELRLCEELLAVFPKGKQATDIDWETEYLDKILSVKEVRSVEAAISHIRRFGSRHTEVILTEDKVSAEMFRNGVDASCVGVNVSTRFNDGAQLGLGAELGISTSKIHCYGPMGAGEMTIERFEIESNYQVRT